jgi:DNA-binding XRE family transcriptional regulator
MIRKNTLGPTFKALRKMAHMTQAELALAVGLERTSITNIERQNQALSDLLAEKIAHALGYRIVVRFEKR